MTPLLIILFALCAVTGVMYVVWRTEWAFVLVVTMFPLEQLFQAYVPYLYTHSRIFNYVVGGLAVFAVVSRGMRNVPTLAGYNNATTWLTILLYILWCAGILYSPNPPQAQLQFDSGWPYFILLLGFLPLLISDIFTFRRMLIGLMVVGTATAILIMINPKTSYYAGRLVLDLGMTGTLEAQGSPLALAEMGGMIALVAALMYPPRAGFVVLALRIAAFIAGFGLAIGSGSRGQVLAAGIAGVLFYPLARRLVDVKTFFFSIFGLGVLVLGIIGVFSLFVGDQNRVRWDVGLMLRDMLARLDLVWGLCGVYLDSPAHWLFGLGTGAASAYFDTNYVHNTAAETLCEHGVVGFGLFVAIVALTVRNGWGLWREHRGDPAMRATVAVLLAICAYSLFNALKQGSMFVPAPFYWWMVLAKLAMVDRQEAALAAQASYFDGPSEEVEDLNDAYAIT